MDKRDFEQYVNTIRMDTLPYDSKNTTIKYRESISKRRTTRIKNYFKKHTNLDLDSIVNSKESTWQKAILLAVFIANSIPHYNGWVKVNGFNAINLWKASRKHPEGLNCRCHAILFSELLLAVGIKNCFVTCLPKDKNDTDCHVVNHIWLPETKSWAMLDSDMTSYVVDENERPLSLKEMRESLMKNKEFFIRPLPGFDDAWVVSDEGKCYWAKNLYWFAKHSRYCYNLESGFCLWGDYVCLVPKGFHYDRKKFTGREVTNDVEFWDLN